MFSKCFFPLRFYFFLKFCLLEFDVFFFLISKTFLICCNFRIVVEESFLYLFQTQMNIVNSNFENVLCNYFIESSADPDTNFSITLQNIYFNNLSSFYSLMSLYEINVNIDNSTFQNILCDFFIYSFLNPNDNYSLILQNIYCTNLTSTWSLIYLIEINVNIANSIFEDSYCGADFIFYSADPTNNYYFTLESIYCNNVTASWALIYFNETDLKIINSTFEDNNCGSDLIVFFSEDSSTHSITLQNITIERNNIYENAIGGYGGIIYLILDSFFFNQNIVSASSAYQISQIFGGNISFLNSLVFTNNYDGTIL